MLTVGVDSYVTIEEAIQLAEGHPFYSQFVNSNITEKECLLREAAMKIELLPFSGRKKSIMQYLSFPRENQQEVPYQVKSAQVLEALESFDKEKNQRLEWKAQGISSVTLGQVSESYNGNEKRKTLGLLRSETASALLRRYLSGSFPIV